MSAAYSLLANHTREGWEVGARSVQQSFVHLPTDLGMRDPVRRPDQQIT